VHDLFDGLPLGVYSALRTFEHVRFFDLQGHLERTDRSLELLGWPDRLERDGLRRALDACVRAYPQELAPDLVVRFDLLARAPETLGIPQRTLIGLAPLVPVPESFLRQGVSVRFTPLRRARPLIKTATFVVERRPYPLGTTDAYEHLLLDERGTITEGTSSNFLALWRGVLRIAGDEALQGVTQRAVVELAREAGLEVRREPVRRDELGELQECFLTGSTRGIVPVIAVEGLSIGSGKPGPWTERLRRAYDERARARARPAVEAG
jgi:branched-subunit amino acid aminotransferase/4-amino-4-deoxychorismate lyase